MTDTRTNGSLTHLSNECLVNMICGIDCGEEPFVMIYDVKKEILTRLREKEKPGHQNVFTYDDCCVH